MKPLLRKVFEYSEQLINEKKLQKGSRAQEFIEQAFVDGFDYAASVLQRKLALSDTDDTAALAHNAVYYVTKLLDKERK